MLDFPAMDIRILRAVFLLAGLSGCATAVPELMVPPDGISWAPDAPFRDQPKTEIPSEALAFNHFLIGHLLLGEGNFDGALKELEAAAAAKPDEAFLHFRLASFYLRRGDL
jgi:tetratricopeptide (TPR) repeat protein